MELLAAHYESEQKYLKLISNAKREARNMLNTKIVTEKDKNPFKCTTKDVYNELNTTSMAQSTYLKKVKKEDRATDPLLSAVSKVCAERAEKKVEWEKNNTVIAEYKISKDKVATEIENVEARIKVVAHALSQCDRPTEPPAQPIADASRPAIRAESPARPISDASSPAIRAESPARPDSREEPSEQIEEEKKDPPTIFKRAASPNNGYEELPGYDILEQIRNGDDE